MVKRPVSDSVVDCVWARTGADSLSEKEALALGYDELKAMRRKRGESGKATSQRG